MEEVGAEGWRRSRRCDSGACVEVAPINGGIALRDSKDPDGPILMFTREEWNAFLDGARAGDFHFG
jgi:hypothetical protein